MKTLNKVAAAIGWFTIVLFVLGTLDLGDFTYRFGPVKETTSK